MDTKDFVLLDPSTPSKDEVKHLAHFNKRVIGQDSAKAAALRALLRSKNPLRDPRRPICVLLLIGESRTGKTLTAEMIAEILHGDPEAMVKIDCGSYKEKHRISQLLGSPVGYVGYRDPSIRLTLGLGQRDTSALLSRDNLVASRKGSKTPVSVVLLDEIEKASAEFEDVLLSIYDKGKLDLGNNSAALFNDCIFVMTSNLASDEVEKTSRGVGRVGFGAHLTDSKADVREVIQRRLADRYKPEFRNRIDEIVIFERLTPQQVKLVVDVELTLLEERIPKLLPADRVFTLKVDSAAREFILAETTRDNGNIAQLKRVMAKHIEDPLGRELNKGTISGGDTLVVGRPEGAVALTFSLGLSATKPTGWPKKGQVIKRDDAELKKRVAHAKLRAPGRIKSFELSQTSTGKTMDELRRVAINVPFDLLYLFEVEVVKFGSGSGGYFHAQIRASQEQADLVKLLYPSLNIRELQPAAPAQ